MYHPPTQRQHVPAVRPRIRAVPRVLRVPGLDRSAGAVLVHGGTALSVDVQPGRLHNRGDGRRGTGQHIQTDRGHGQRQVVAVQDEEREQILFGRGEDQR